MNRRCKRLEKIAVEITDTALKLYEDGKMVEFWGAIESLDMLNSVKDSACELPE